MGKFYRLILLTVVFLSGCNLFEMESSDASLSSVTLSVGNLSPAFSATLYQYTATVEASDDSVTITIRPGDGNASIAIGGRRIDGPGAIEVSLDYGTNEVTITVLSENRKRQGVYRIAITRAAPTFSVGGSVSGLAGSLTLQNNGGDDVLVTADGSFVFPGVLDDGTDYAVTVSSQPAGQQCSVTNGSGTISSADISNVSVSCVSENGIYRVGGTISGLVGTGILQLNGGQRLLIASNGSFIFGPALPDGANYEVNVLEQPAAQTCTVSNGTGTFAGDNVLDVRVACIGTGVATGSIFDWDWVSPLPHGNSITDFATNGTRLVAVGSQGQLQSTTDGLNWTRHDSGIRGYAYLTGITWGGGRFVVVSDGGSIITSADGVTWETATELSWVSLQSVTWNGSVYVAVGYNLLTGSQGAIATSSDGTNWSVQTIDQPNALIIQDIAWNGSVFAAIQFPDYVLTSGDGTNWTSMQIAAAGGAPLDAIASNGSRFVAVGSGGLVFTSDDDGATWNQETNPIPLLTAVGLEWDGSRFVALGLDSYATSADGSTWTEHVVNASPETVFLTSMIRFAGLNIIGAGNGAIYTSPDDASWTTPFSRTFNGVRDVVWDGAQFITVGADQTIRTSPDGLTWTTRYEAPLAGVLLDITQGGGQYVAVGSGATNQVLTSPDAITWTGHTVSMTNIVLSDVASGNGMFVAVGNNNALLLTSPDGASWTAQSSGFDGDERFYSAGWSGSVWVVSGWQFSGGSFTTFLATSPDGVDWTKQPLPFWTYFDSMASNGTLLVAVGANAIATSTDGLSWSILQSTVAGQNIVWTGSEFLVVGTSVDILSSPDGMNWSVSPTLSGFYSGVAGNGTTTVVVNFQGNVLVRTTP